MCQFSDCLRKNKSMPFVSEFNWCMPELYFSIIYSLWLGLCTFPVCSAIAKPDSEMIISPRTTTYKYFMHVTYFPERILQGRD